VSSRVRAKCWLLSSAVGALVLFGCQSQPVMPAVGGKCKPGTLVMCVCPGALSQGFIPCGADRTVTPCGGCAEPPPPTAAGAAGSPSASGAALGVAGQASSFAGRGAAGSSGSFAATGGGSFGAAGSVAPAATGCALGEMCKTSLRGGGVRFCTRDPAANLPPACTTPGQACGTNGAGNCVDARPLGSPGMLFCIYSSC
jgi:hypothetical protein